jgi:hypothetical protein
VNLAGQWQWTSSKQPLLFRNWASYYPGFLKKQLLISKENPFAWFNHEIKDEKGFYSDYFICESSAPQQEIKHLKANANAKVKNPDAVIFIPSKLTKHLGLCGRIAHNRSGSTRRVCTWILTDVTASS